MGLDLTWSSHKCPQAIATTRVMFRMCRCVLFPPLIENYAASIAVDKCWNLYAHRETGILVASEIKKDSNVGVHITLPRGILCVLHSWVSAL